MTTFQQSKLNKKLVGILAVVLTVLYLLVTTAFAQDQNKTAGTGITYNKDYLSYGDIWAFDSATHTASNYSKKGSAVTYYIAADKSTSKTSNSSAKTTQSYYADVTASGYTEPKGTLMPTHAATRFIAGAVSQGTVPSPVGGPDIPVITTTVTNNTVRYSVVPDTVGIYYVYVYSENSEFSVNYATLDSPQASIDYNDANGLPNKPLNFESVGANWYRAPIEVKTVRWHAVELKNTTSRKESGKNTDASDTGGQDTNMGLGNDPEYTNYNTWSVEKVYYNTVLVFQFDNKVKLGPITKTGDTITITNPNLEKGDVTAYTIFGEKIDINTAVTLPHSPVIISGEAKGAYMLDEVKVETGSGQMSALGDNYIYPFEDTSEISVSWTKLVKLPSITVTGATDDITMNFFGAKTAAITHPGNEERTYTFTADFTDASDMESLEYSYTITDLNGKPNTISGVLTQDADNFSIDDVCYEKIVVTFTAVDTEGDTFSAECTIYLSMPTESTAPFKVVNNYYWTWEKAVAAANSQSGNNKRVILNANYTLPKDLYGNGMLTNGTYVTVSSDGRVNYDLPSGVTFIVPYAASFNYSTTGDHPYACENQPIMYEAGIVAVGTKVYLELTAPGNVSIGVSGVMAVGGTTDGSCEIYEAHSNVHLEEGAEINVASKAILSSCGYIYGEGTVNAENGSTVYMPFSVVDFRGGGYTVGTAGKLSTNYGLTPVSGEGKGISPFLRYTMNAIQCKLVVKQGATVTGYVCLAANSELNSTNATVIGPSAGLIKTESAQLDITYDPNTYASTYSAVGRTKIVINGKASFGNLNLTVKTSLATAKINTADVNFPIPYNYDIEIESGTFSVPNKLMLLPGARVTVGKDATLNVSSSLTIYDGLHDYTSSGTSEVTGGGVIMKGYESGTNYTVLSPYTVYPSTAVLQGATFGGSGSADLIVNGTMNLNSGSTIAGIIQTGGGENAKITTASGIDTSTTTQIGAVGSYSAIIQSSYFAGATVRTLTGEILDTGTGNRTKIVGGKTYYPAAGAGNISSYTYKLYYMSRDTSKFVTLTDEVACILQGSWWNYAVTVHTIKDNVDIEQVTMYFAHGADVSQYYTDKACTKPASTANESTKDLYFDVKNSEAMILWADGSEESYYLTVRNAVQDATHTGDRIVLMKNLNDFSSIIAPSADQDFIFDMDGWTINYKSTPFASISGGHMTVELNGGTTGNQSKGSITNKVGNKYYDSPVLNVTEGSSLTLNLNGGKISVTGGNGTTLVNGGVENSGNLTIDLGGGTWEYKTGLVVPKASNDAGTQHHDLTVMAAYQSKAMFNNTGVLTIKDTGGNGTVTTDLISNGITLTPATPTTNYVSVIRNNAGATLYLDGGTFILEPKGDKENEAILSTAATPIPMVTYGAGILNFGTIRSSGTGSAVSVKASGSYALYNLKGGSVDLDLRGGTLELTEYEKGTEQYAAMYNGKYVVVNDGDMNLRSTDGQGKVLMSVETTTGALHGILNSNNAAIFSTLTLDGIDMEVLHSASASSYGVYNRAGSKINGIKNTNITMALGQAVNSTGSATTTTTIGDITNSTFTVSKRYASEDGTVTAVNGSNAFAVTYTDIGHIKDSNFSSVDTYALSATSGSTIKSITGGSFKSAASGGLNLGSLASAAANAAKAVQVGDITGVEFDVHTIGINAAGAAASAYGKAVGPEIGNITGSTFKTNTGNGMTIAGVNANASGAAAAPTVGNITGCTFNTGAYGFAISGGTLNATGGAAAAPKVGNISDCNITAATYGISISGHPGNTDFPHAIATVGDINGNTVNSGTVGIYLTYANAGVIEDCHLTSSKLSNSSGVIHVTNLSSVKYIKDTDIVSEETATSTNSTACGIYTSGGVTIGDISGCEITTSKGPAISNNATAALGVASIGNITDCTIKSGAGGIAGASGQVTATAAGAAPVFGDIIRTTFDTVTYGINIAGYAATANGDAVAPTVGNITDCTFNVGSYGINVSGGAVHASGGAAAAPTVGNITDCEINAVTYGIQIAGAAGNTAFPEHAFAAVGDFTGTKIYAGTSATAGAYYGIYLSYANAGAIKDCTLESGIASNNTGVLHVINRSTVKDITETDITVRGTSANTTTAGIYTSASTIGDIIHCKITSSKGPAISHNATAALGVSTIGDITDCTIVSGAGGIVGAGGAATATAEAAAPVIGDITKTTFETVTYGISIGSAGANTYNVGAGAKVGNITGCDFTVGSYGIQIAGGAGTAAQNYEDVGFASCGDVTDTKVNAGTYSLYFNYCKGSVIDSCIFNSTNPASGSYVLGNANGSEIKSISAVQINVTAPTSKSYGIYNNGGEIGLIENSPINAPYGIYNLNVRITAHTTETGSTISYYGHIGTIKDVDVTVAQWALQNRGVIDEIVGKCTFIAANPSAQVPWNHGSIANSNAAANTFVNYNTWWGSDGNSTIWKQTDVYSDTGALTRTVEYLWDDDHIPTIGKISGDIQIIAENTSNNAAHGVAMINNGIIKEISGNVAIETYVHPQNAAITSSSYGIQNTSGGRIDKITGNVKISAGAYAIQNSTGQLYIKNAVTYAGGTATSGQETSIDRTYYYDYTGIGEIIGNTYGDGIIIEATAGSYAIENHARIGNITGKVSITADKGSYAIQNTTGTTINITQTMSWPGTEDTPKTYHQEYLMASIGTIGGGNSEIMISSNGATNNTYTLQNNGRIEAILEGVTIKDLTGYTGVPTIFNSEASYTVLDYTYEHLRYDSNLGRYYTKVLRDYVYEQPYIREIRGVTVSASTNYALRNTGVIESITNSSFTAATGYGIDNTLSYAAADGNEYARETVQIFYGTTPLAVTTSHLGEQTIWFTRSQATIGELDNVTITVESGNYGIQNAGIIDSITNSTIKVLNGNYAIGNSVRAATGEDVSMMDDYIYLNDAGSYVATPAGSITDKVWSYAAPSIKSIGAGNTIEALSQTIYNTGHIETIDSEDGDRTTITATGNTAATQYAIYNYRGLVTHQERSGSTTTVDTNTGAQIDSIRNVSISSVNSVAVYNGDGTANLLHPVIMEIGEGTEVTSVAANAVYNHATNAEIRKITGGIFTTGEGSFYALYNNSTTFPIELSEGFFKGGTDKRDNAIYQPDVATRYTYPEDMFLSKKTKTATFADGSEVDGYYFITENVLYIIFDGNGATDGEMKQQKIPLKDGLENSITLNQNQFTMTLGGTSLNFKGWDEDKDIISPALPDQWHGTIAELWELLKGETPTEIDAGEEITLYAIWDTDDTSTVMVTWGDMSFRYTWPRYRWNAWDTKYELETAGGWTYDPDADFTETDENGNSLENNVQIKVIGATPYLATLKFNPFASYNTIFARFSGLDAFDELTNGVSFTLPGNSTQKVRVDLDGKPNDRSLEKEIVGTLILDFQKIAG